MATLFKNPTQVSAYRDRSFPGTQEEFEDALRTSATVYVGNMSFYTTEEQIHDLFSRVGELKKIMMGLDKNTMTPCGFCFVLYYSRQDAEDAVKYLSGTSLDGRPVRVDFDWGFREGRQWGRGRSGGQVRDEYRTDYDTGRGGYGKLVQTELNIRRQREASVRASLSNVRHHGSRRGYRDFSRHVRVSGYKRSRGAYEQPEADASHRGSDPKGRPTKNPRFREIDEDDS